MSGFKARTVADIISQGDYLDDDFDPVTLTVPQLLGIFSHHRIRHPVPYTKSKLVQLFLDEITPEAPGLRKANLQRQNSVASDDGITNGITGQPLHGQTAPATRSSRRLTSALKEGTVIRRPEPTKRRRSSAEPSLGGSSKSRASALQPTVMEESEPEEMPARKLSRNEKADASYPARRTSLGDDSGWEDNNIFQSGAESSSPARPSPARKGVRKRTVSRKSRNSMSAPPHLSPSSSPPKAPVFQSPQLASLQPKFEPQLPAGVLRQSLSHSPRSPTVERKRLDDVPVTPFQPSRVLDDVSTSEHKVTHIVKVSPGDDEASDSGKEVACLEPVANDDSTDQSQPLTLRRRSRRYLLAPFYAISLVICLTIVINFKIESESIGYCDASSNTSRTLEEFQADLSAKQACIRNNQTISNFLLAVIDGITLEDGTPCSPLSLMPLPHPSACTPCPEYATCTSHTAACDSGYILRPHPFLALLSPLGTASPAPVEVVWNFMSKATNGLPGLGPIAFPPRCIEDPKRKRNIGALGKAIEALLGQERGRRVCAGGPLDQAVIPDTQGGEARKWGLEIEALRETMKQKTAPHLLETFNDTFNEAIQQLAQWGNVLFGEDVSGKRYLAHRTTNMTLGCHLIVKVRTLWLRWRSTVFACIAGSFALYILRRTRAQRQIEAKRVGELVQITLDTLRNQEIAYHTDPVTAPQAYLSSLQLRDLILQGEHSISARKRLWEQVERVVEGNANVRANLEEVQGGDELRVWRWVGTAGRDPKYRKRVRTDAKQGDKS